jgi:hypothetical protein
MRATRISWLESAGFRWPVARPVSLDSGGDEHEKKTAVLTRERRDSDPAVRFEVAVFVGELQAD